MSKQKTIKDEHTILTSIDAKLSAMLAILMRAHSDALEGSSTANVGTVGFLKNQGLDAEEIAQVLSSTKNSVQVMQSRLKKKPK